LDLIKEIP